MDGVLVIDKPSGKTSHDVVARVRRELGTRDVGHAGTLDPLATGVLLVLVGQATKLAAYLTAANKVYSATITLGVATASLDADGEVTDRAPVPANVLAELAALAASMPAATLSAVPALTLSAALASEQMRTEQVPPLVSAIHVDGVRAHKIARKKGAESVTLPSRAVRVRALQLLSGVVEPPSIDVELDVDKGYYVRAFARDLAAALGTVGHVSRLRRIASGSFTLADATTLDALRDRGGGEKGVFRMLSLGEAVGRAMPVAILTDAGVTLTRHGKPIPLDAFSVAPASDAAHAFMAEDGSLVAIGALEAGVGRVLRGFHA